MNKKSAFKALYPNAFFLDAEEKDELASYLKELQIMSTDDQISDVCSPGAGNMNYVLRVKTSSLSIIIKQARPWVEKYPTISAPIERIDTETAYYNAIGDDKILGGYSPRIIATDPENFIIIMEDLGQIKDMSSIYDTNTSIPDTALSQFAEYLVALHSLPLDNGFTENTSMKQLNHEHIFKIPFVHDSDLQIDGLEEFAQSVKNDAELVNRATQWGNIYLNKSECIIHGDFYPGSIMSHGDQMYVIDPEFSHVGHPAFDVGVFVAHMYIAQLDDSLIDLFIEHYQTQKPLDQTAMWSFAGIEVIRRILGVAQLPLSMDNNDKAALVERARQWIDVV